MRPLSAIVVHKDSTPAQTLANSLRQHFRFVSTAASYDDARDQVQHHRAQLLIVDLETAGLDHLKRLNEEFPGATIVCTHRIPDEELWVEALTCGAADCCCQSDVRAIVLAASRNIPPARARTAVA